MSEAYKQCLAQQSEHIPKPKAPKLDQRFWSIFLIILIILFGVALLAHAYVGFYTRYMADDYCTAAAVNNDGLLSTQKNIYMSWSGRFSFNVAICVLILLSQRIVPFIPALGIALLLAGLTWAISQFGSVFTWRRPLLTSFLLAELIIFATVSDNRGGVYEALYWQTGVLTYWYPLIFLVAYVGFVKKVDASPTRKHPGALYLASSAALAFFAGGLNETYAILQISGLLVAIALSLWARRFKVLQVLVAGLTGAVVAMTIVYLAPGNSVRRSNFPPPPDLLTLLRSSVESTFNFMFAEQNYPGTFFFRVVAVLIPTMLALLATRREGESAGRDEVSVRRAQLLTMLILPIACFVLVMSCFAPALYVMSRQPPPRALIIPEFVLISLLVAWGYCAGHLLRYRYLEGGRLGFSSVAAVSLVLTAALALAPIQAARRTFSKVSRVKALALRWDQQDQEIRAARDRGETDLTVPVAYNIGGTDLMTANPQWYVNRCVADYYRLNTITAKPSVEGLKIMTEVPEE